MSTTSKPTVFVVVDETGKIVARPATAAKALELINRASDFGVTLAIASR